MTILITIDLPLHSFVHCCVPKAVWNARVVMDADEVIGPNHQGRTTGGNNLTLRTGFLKVGQRTTPQFANDIFRSTDVEHFFDYCMFPVSVLRFDEGCSFELRVILLCMPLVYSVILG